MSYLKITLRGLALIWWPRCVVFGGIKRLIIPNGGGKPLNASEVTLGCFVLVWTPCSIDVLTCSHMSSTGSASPDTKCGTAWTWGVVCHMMRNEFWSHSRWNPQGRSWLSTGAGSWNDTLQRHGCAAVCLDVFASRSPPCFLQLIIILSFLLSKSHLFPLLFFISQEPA